MSNVMVTTHPPVTHVVGGVNPTTTTVLTTTAGVRIRENYAEKTSRALGGTQIAMGVLAFLAAILGIIFQAQSSYSAYGIWCGVPIIIGGVLGVVAAKQKTESIITGYLVMSIIDMCLAGLMGLISIIALAADSTVWRYDFDYGYMQRSSNGGEITADVLIMIAAIVSGGSFIWSTVIAANCCAGPRMQTTYVTTNTGQPGVVYAQPQYVVQQQYGAPPQQQYAVQQYAAQPQQQYAAQPQQQYAAQPQQPYGVPPQQGYGVPPQQYGAPPPQYDPAQDPTKPPPYAPQYGEKH